MKEKRNECTYAVEVMSESEMTEVNGGRFVKWWMYLISPGGAFIAGRFEDGLLGK